MWFRLPYRLQIPLGLSLAVLLTALLVTVVAARSAAATARSEIEAAISRASVLLSGQAKPYLLSNDTWRAFVLLRDIAGLLPAAAEGHSNAAILGADAHTLASSDPSRFPTSAPVPGVPFNLIEHLKGPSKVDLPDGGVALVSPVLSEDGAKMGYSLVAVERAAFEPDWATLGKSAALGAALSVLFLAPLGWIAGRRMTRPIRELARAISRIGQDPSTQIESELSSNADPELARIYSAVRRLIAELRERQQAQRRALSSERLAAVGRMTAAVAHEINNPLGGLINAVQTLKVHGDSEATRRRSVDLLQRGLHQIRVTVSALLPQARIEDRDFGAQDFDDVLTLAGPAAVSRSVVIRGVSSIEADAHIAASILRQVLLNLVLNAVKAADADDEVLVKCAIDDEAVEITVQHRGKAFSQADLQTIVDSTMGDDPRGFGLWVCHQIALQRGGRFGVDESHKPGTRMVFRIPNRESHEDHSVS